MNTVILTVVASILPGFAIAHAGHLGELAGHDHLVAGAAIAIAIALGLREALKGQKAEKDAEVDAEDAETA